MEEKRKQYSISIELSRQQQQKIKIKKKSDKKEKLTISLVPSIQYCQQSATLFLSFWILCARI